MDFLLVLFLGFIISLALVLLIMPLYIKLLKSLHYNQSVSEYALDEYKDKATTPIMGGLLFVLVPIIVSIIINPSTIKDPNYLIIVLSFVLYCFIGFLDDILIILRHNNDGLSPKLKLIMQFGFGFIIYFIFKDYINTDIKIPLVDISLSLGSLYVFFMVFMYMAETNAVNFTDGMDGLSSGVSIIALIPYVIFALIDTQYNVAILLVSIIGALLGYLYYNFEPAKIFMGDSGSLAIGALFVAVAVVLNRELLLIIVGGVFFIEMLCVCIQQVAVRAFHKRVFRYTPIHYAFVLRGMKPKKVVLRFYLVATIFALIGFMIGVL